MTVYELKTYLDKYSSNGYSDAPVFTANKEWNPVTDGDDIGEILFIERKDGTAMVVLQTD